MKKDTIYFKFDKKGSEYQPIGFRYGFPEDRVLRRAGLRANYPYYYGKNYQAILKLSETYNVVME